MSNGQSLLFIEVSATGKVRDKKDRHAIQKHVMRDAATERRRQTKLKREKNQECQELVSVPKRDPKQKPQIDEEAPELFFPSLDSSPPIGGFGAGRMNPFEQYPIQMDLEKLFLIDYG